MLKIVRNFVVIVLLAAAVAAGWLLYRAPDPVYTAQEWLHPARFREYDAEILAIAKKHDMDPMLIKAVIWRESGFHPEKVGKDGERGLMQVGEAAAREWVKAQKIENFMGTNLFDPKTNIDAGTWYLRQAMQRWPDKDDPIPFALAEYNAGHSTVERWIQESNMGKKATAADLRDSISYPSTKKYVDDIGARYRFYQKRGWM